MRLDQALQTNETAVVNPTKGIRLSEAVSEDKPELEWRALTQEMQANSVGMTPEQEQAYRKAKEIELVKEFPTNYYSGVSAKMESFAEGVLPIRPKEFKRPGVVEAHPIANAVGKLAGLITTGIMTAGVAPAVTFAPQLAALPTLARFAAGRMAQSGITFGLKELTDNMAELIGGEKKDFLTVTKDVLTSTAFGAGLGAVGSIASPIARIPAQAAYGYMTSKMGGATNQQAGINAGMFAVFGLFNTKNLNVAYKEAAYAGAKEALADRMVAQGVNKERAAMVADRYFRYALHKAGAMRSGKPDWNNIKLKDLDSFNSAMRKGYKIILDPEMRAANVGSDVSMEENIKEFDSGLAAPISRPLSQNIPNTVLNRVPVEKRGLVKALFQQNTHEAVNDIINQDEEYLDAVMQNNTAPKNIYDNTKTTDYQQTYLENPTKKLAYSKIPAAKGKPEVIFIIGMPGSQKSQYVKGLGKDATHVQIDPDDAKEYIPKFASNKNLAGNVHLESAYMAEVVLADKAIADKKNIVWPKLGKNPVSLKEKIDMMRENGYKVILVHNGLSTTESIKRTYKRWAEDGRLVDKDYIRDLDSLTIKEVYDKLKMDVDEFLDQNVNVAYGLKTIKVEEGKNVISQEQELGRVERGQPGVDKTAQGKTQAAQAIPKTRKPAEVKPSKPTVRQTLKQRLGELQDNEAKRSYLKEALDEVDKLRSEYVGQIKRYKDGYLKEELQKFPKSYITTKQTGMFPDEAMQQLRDSGIDIKDEVALKDYFQDIETRRAEIKDELKNLQPKKITYTEPTIIKRRLADMKRSFKEGKAFSLKEIKAVQKELIDMISFLEAKDRAKFIRTIKNVQTVKQLEDVVDSIAYRMQRIHEQTQKAKIGVSIKKELTKTKPAKQGDRKIGKYDYESNELFKKLRSYSNLSQKKAQEALDNMPGENLSTMDLIRRRMLSMKSNGAASSLEIYQRVLSDIQMLKEIGTAVKDNESFDKMVNRQENVEEALAGIDKVKSGAVKKGYAQGFGNIHSVYNMVFGKKFADKYNPEIDESRRNTAIYFKTKSVTEKASKIYGDKNILKVFQDMAQEKYELTDFEGLNTEISRMELIDIYNSLKNPVVEKRYHDAFGEDQINGLMSKLSPQDMEVADLLRESVQEYRPVLNDRNIEITGQDLGNVENYWPATSEYQPSVYDDVRMQGETPSAMKERAKGKVIPRPVNAWHKFGKHIAEAEHVENLSREHEALKRMLTDRRVKHEIIQRFDENVYRTMIQQLDSISLNAQTANVDAVSTMFEKALNNWVKAKLPSPSILLRQLMSASNYMEVMPVAKWAAGYTKGVLQPKKTFDYMWKNAPFLEARFHKGYKEALSRALDDAQKMSVGQSNWAMGLSAMVRAGDISAIIYGGKPYVDHLISTGMSKERAFEEFEKATLRAQQAGLNSSLSEFQKKKGFYRMMLAFKNTPAQYLRKMGDATISWRNGDISGEQYAKTMTIYGVIQPILYVMAGFAVKEGLKKLGSIVRGDDRDTEWGELGDDIIMQLIVNPVTAVPFLSGFARYFIRKKMGKKAYNMTSLPMISDLETVVRKLGKEEITFDDWVTIAGTASEITTSAPILQVKRIYEYLTKNEDSGSTPGKL